MQVIIHVYSTLILVAGLKVDPQCVCLCVMLAVAVLPCRIANLAGIYSTT